MCNNAACIKTGLYLGMISSDFFAVGKTFVRTDYNLLKTEIENVIRKLLVYMTKLDCTVLSSLYSCPLCTIMLHVLKRFVFRND